MIAICKARRAQKRVYVESNRSEICVSATVCVFIYSRESVQVCLPEILVSQDTSD
jgi:hypothetical protein